ncbi:hypothetical protein ACFL2O_03445 [Thermodesulfobacteriota bacterium]
MTVSIQIEPETGVAIATCSGVLRSSDAQEGATALWKTPGWSGRSVVWDFREAQFDISSLDTQNIAQFILAHQPATPPLKVAFVTQRDLDFGLARVFDAYRDDPRTAFQVFRDYEEAISWARLLEPDAA